MSAARRFGRNLMHARAEKGLTQEQLGLRAGLDAAAVSRIESGSREPRIATIVRLAKALEIAPGTLFEDL
jgi:transcriptional regulator with XRE-family HTH domain